MTAAQQSHQEKEIDYRLKKRFGEFGTRSEVGPGYDTKLQKKLFPCKIYWLTARQWKRKDIYEKEGQGSHREREKNER